MCKETGKMMIDSESSLIHFASDLQVNVLVLLVSSSLEFKDCKQQEERRVSQITMASSLIYYTLYTSDLSFPVEERVITTFPFLFKKKEKSTRKKKRNTRKSWNILTVDNFK